MGNKFRNRNERNKMRWLLGGSIILILWLIGLNCETQSLMSIGWVALSFLVRSFSCPPASVTFLPLLQFYLFLPPLSCFYQITKLCFPDKTHHIFPIKIFSDQDLNFAQLHIGWNMSTGVFRQYWISLYWSKVECLVHKLCMVKYFSLPPYMHHLCSIHVTIIIDHPSAVIVCPPV